MRKNGQLSLKESLVMLALLTAQAAFAQDPMAIKEMKPKRDVVPKPAAHKTTSHAAPHKTVHAGHKGESQSGGAGAGAGEGAGAAEAGAAKPVIKHIIGGASTESIRAYCSQVWGKLQNNWQLPDGNNHVTLSGPIDSDGSLGEISANSSPKNGDAEAAAMSALERSKPLNLLPKGMARGKITIIFDSKADPHGDSSSGGSVRLDPVNQ